LTGQLARTVQPWLVDHEVLGHVLVPASALVELAVRAGDEVGCPMVRELAMTAPLTVPERGGLQLHVMVGDPDPDGGDLRTVEIHARPDTGDGEWTLHARGMLSGIAVGAGEWAEQVWPPAGAQAVDVDAAYEALADRGYGYGPAFRAVRAVWRRGEDVFAEVSAAQALDLAGFGVHPALLDAVVHAPMLAADPGDADEVRVPFLWEGVMLHAVGATAMRVKISPAGADAATVQVVDETGAPVLGIGSLVTRAVSHQALAAAASTAPESLFEVVWSPVTTPLMTTPPNAEPPVTVWEWRSEPGAAQIASMHAATHAALAAVQARLEDSERPDSVLAVVTRGAVALSGEGVADLAASAVWGLVRSAQSENPGRFVLIDTDAELS
ncbi:polyketide synthase dehydratase domain-containing protein, partial [Streptomyces sp. NPDC002690]